jgi:site-specific DNA-cytosine methylase
MSPAITEAIGRAGSSSEYLNSLKAVQEASGLNTADGGASYAIDKNYWKGTSPGDIGSGRRTQIIQQNQREEVVSKEESGAIHESMSSRQAPKVLNSEMHSTDAVHHPSGIASTVRAKAGGKTRGLGILQIPRGQNDGGKHGTCPTVSSNSWQENNFLEEVQPVHSPEFAEKDMNMKSRVGSEDGSMFTVDGSSQHGVTDKKRIRKLTPKECWRLQGFPDESFEAAQKVNSDTQLYKQAGNAVTVNVIKHLGIEIEKIFTTNKQIKKPKIEVDAP